MLLWVYRLVIYVYLYIMQTDLDMMSNMYPNRSVMWCDIILTSWSSKSFMNICAVRSEKQSDLYINFVHKNTEIIFFAKYPARRLSVPQPYPLIKMARRIISAGNIRREMCRENLSVVAHFSRTKAFRAVPKCCHLVRGRGTAGITPTILCIFLALLRRYEILRT